MRLRLDTVYWPSHDNYAVMVSMRSRCRETLDLVDIEQYCTSLVDFGSLPSTHLYQKRFFLVMKPTILERYRLASEQWDTYGRCVKLAGTVIDVSREGKSISVAREFMF